MNARIKELAERRDYLVAQSDREREQVAGCAERVSHFFSRNTMTKALKSSAGSVVGLIVLRWAGKKLLGVVGSLLGRQAARAASGWWHRR